MEISVHKVQTEQSEEQVRVGEKDEGKTREVLCELDLNCGGQDSMEVKFRQGGSWKRRARAKSLQVGQENEKD